MSDCDCKVEVESRQQSRVLVTLLAINAVMFVVEAVTGVLAESTGLIADSLDMLADAVVYGIGLYAVGKAADAKIGAARASGYFQMALALLVAFDVIRRAVVGSDPEPAFMILIGMIALAANVVCLRLISKHRDGGVHMRASWIFSRNDVIANTGVILSGGLVLLTGARWPDLIVGSVITCIVFRGGLTIIADARDEQESRTSTQV